MSKDDPKTNGKNTKHKRVNVYLIDEEYNKLRSTLILKNTSVSEWIRIIIKDFLAKQEAKKQEEIAKMYQDN